MTAPCRARLTWRKASGMPQNACAKEPPDAACAVRAYIALGANLGDAAATVQRALTALNTLPLTRLWLASSLYKTAALETESSEDEGLGDPEYVNAVAAIDTALSAPVLLAHLQALELAAGRERPYRNAPRTLDLDLLLYGAARIDSVRLTVPHPRMLFRAFVLVPLAEIAPELVSNDQLQAVKHQAIERLAPRLPTAV